MHLNKIIYTNTHYNHYIILFARKTEQKYCSRLTIRLKVQTKEDLVPGALNLNIHSTPHCSSFTPANNKTCSNHCHKFQNIGTYILVHKRNVYYNLFARCRLDERRIIEKLRLNAARQGVHCRRQFYVHVYWKFKAEHYLYKELCVLFLFLRRYLCNPYTSHRHLNSSRFYAVKKSHLCGRKS